jgi:hypothetical protein
MNDDDGFFQVVLCFIGFLSICLAAAYVFIYF